MTKLSGKLKEKVIVRANQNGANLLIACAHFEERYPCWLPKLNTRVVQTSCQEAGRILCSFLHIIDWAVFHHVLKVLRNGNNREFRGRVDKLQQRQKHSASMNATYLFFIGTPPFKPLSCCERNSRVNHCWHNVHKRYA